MQAPAVFPVPRGRRGAAERLPRCGGAVHAGTGGGLRVGRHFVPGAAPLSAPLGRKAGWSSSHASPPSADHADPLGDRKASSAPRRRSCGRWRVDRGWAPMHPARSSDFTPARSSHSAPATRETAVQSCGRAPNDQRSRPASHAAARAGARSCGGGRARSGGHDAGRSCRAPRSTLRSSTRSGRNCCRQRPPGGYTGRSGPAAARTVPAALPRPACRRAGV